MISCTIRFSTLELLIGSDIDQWAVFAGGNGYAWVSTADWLMLSIDQLWGEGPPDFSPAPRLRKFSDAG
jgi:hypothetical protein